MRNGENSRDLVFIAHRGEPAKENSLNKMLTWREWYMKNIRR